MSARYKIALIISAVLLTLIFSTIALAESHSMPGMDMSGDQTMTPSEEMVKNQGLDLYKPKETMLAGDQQNLMLAGVAGIFIILPVSAWIVSHQRKRARRRETARGQAGS